MTTSGYLATTSTGDVTKIYCLLVYNRYLSDSEAEQVVAHIKQRYSYP
jgi:hypothetical protein